MNKEKLRELVKAHFNLVDHTPVSETFGEVYDENKAFKIVFPGDVLKVGDKVKVVTTEGQESDAPDGYHKLEDGKVIKTEKSIVTEIAEYAKNAEDDGLGVIEDEEIIAAEAAFAAKESISEVQGTTPQNAVTETNVPVSTLTGPVKTEAEVEAEMMMKVKMAVDEAVASAITGIKEEMKSMKAKFEEMAKSPASTKVTMSADANKETFSSENLQSKQMKVMAELMKTKNK
jgi:hypothetical protein